MQGWLIAATFGAVGVLIAGCWLLLWLLRRETLKRGQETQQVHQNQEVLDALKKAALARDRLNSDPDYAQRVRNRFTRE